MPSRTLTVPKGEGGARADRFVGRELALSRAKLKELFESGAVRTGGRFVRKGDLLADEQVLTVNVPEELPALVPEPTLPLEVLRTTPSLVFMSKPSGQPSHPLAPGETGTLANALVARFPECADASEDPREGGLCHRLDIETSGVIVAARSRDAWVAVRKAFDARAVEKHYWALVAGPLPDEGVVDLPLRHRADRVVTALEGGPGAREALSSFRVLARSGIHSLVDVRIETGVLHQVRAHLAAIGAPIAADGLYGGPALAGLDRFFLHAKTLALDDPGSGQWVSTDCPLPPELMAALARLSLDAPPAAH